MSKLTPLTEQERVELVAYLDGELTGEAARAMEARLSLDPGARAEADTLRRTWELLDYLPRPEPSPTFTSRTLSKLVPIRDDRTALATSGTAQTILHDRPWLLALLAGGWAALLLLAALGGRAAYNRAAPREPGDRELVRDLRIIKNKPVYDLVEDVEFVQQLDHPDLFGEDRTKPKGR